jgi:homoserine O-acetyltransferase
MTIAVTRSGVPETNVHGVEKNADKSTGASTAETRTDVNTVDTGAPDGTVKFLSVGGLELEAAA